jgi:hypothetical protein
MRNSKQPLVRLKSIQTKGEKSQQGDFMEEKIGNILFRSIYK